ncbi:MAG: hypothetical protein FJ267_15580 [Planctomycetes bacterium]|nr:hypothetical protein [Planctomycetota bacterium]
MTTSTSKPTGTNRIAKVLEGQPESTGTSALPGSTATSVSSSDVIAQAEKVRDSLRTALQNVTNLITAVRHQRRQSRLMKSTIASLKQLHLLES